MSSLSSKQEGEPLTNSVLNSMSVGNYCLKCFNINIQEISKRKKKKNNKKYIIIIILNNIIYFFDNNKNV